MVNVGKYTSPMNPLPLAEPKVTFVSKRPLNVHKRRLDGMSDAARGFQSAKKGEKWLKSTKGPTRSRKAIDSMVFPKRQLF